MGGTAAFRPAGRYQKNARSKTKRVCRSWPDDAPRGWFDSSPSRDWGVSNRQI